MKKVKSKFKKTIAVIISATMLLSLGTTALPVIAAEVNTASSVSATSGDFEYEVLDDGDDAIEGFTITGDSKSAAQWYADKNGFDFISIGEPWLYQEKEDGTLEITGNNFHYEVEITESEFGFSVKYKSGPLEITFPSYIEGKKVTSIGESAFTGLVASYAKNVVVSEGITTIGKSAFQNSKFESVKLPFSLKTIGVEAFRGCMNLKEITIPNDVESIDDGAFSLTGIKELYIPASVKYCDYPLGFDTFKEVVVDEANQNYYSKEGALFRKSDNVLLLYNIANDRREYKIPEGTSGISGNVFRGGTGKLLYLTIPGSVKVISTGTFYGGNLEKLILEEGIEVIEETAVFNGKIQNIVIPKSVTTIGERALGYTNMDSPNPVVMEHFRIYGYRKTAAEAYAIENGIEFVALPEIENNIEYYILDDDSVEVSDYTGSETEVAIPDILGGYSVSAIGDRAFWCNNIITNVVLPNSIKSIGEQTFQNCENLKEIKIPNSVEKIGIYAFDSCYNLENVEISENVVSIGYMAFCSCKKLKEITIPKSVEVIEKYALGYYNVNVYNDMFKPEKIEGFTIYGYKNTAAEAYATENGFTFIALDEEDKNDDINNDGNVDVNDVTVLQMHLANYDIEVNAQALDVNNDDNVDVTDVTTLQMILAGYDI